MKVAFLLLAAALAIPAQTSAPKPPDTPAGKVFAAWLDAFNSGDRGRMEAFLRQYFPTGLERIDGMAGTRDMTGGFQLLAFTETEPRTIAARLKERDSDTVALCRIELKPDGPPVIAKMMVRPEDRPSNEPPPARLDETAALAALDQEATARTAKDQFSGAVLVARHGKVLLEKAYGLADRERKVPNTLDTQFRLGSMNKMFTSIATLQLVAKGKLSLDETIAKYWPDYPNKELAGKVKIRHLLSHTGGTGDIFGPEFDKHRPELKNLSDYGKLYGSRALKFEPGTRWEYSNYGFLLLGMLIEKVSGESYYDYVREHIFKPAGMTSTDSLPESENVSKRAVGYMKRKDAWVSNTGTLPWRGSSAGGGYSTVRDLLRFAQALESGKLVPRELLAEATRSQFDDPNMPPGMRYGFGMMVAGGQYGHNGGAPGMNGELRVEPKTGRIHVVLSNFDPPAASRLLAFYEQRMPVE